MFNSIKHGIKMAVAEEIVKIFRHDNSKEEKDTAINGIFQRTTGRNKEPAMIKMECTLIAAGVIITFTIF
jgi:hypothetical protein